MKREWHCRYTSMHPGGSHTSIHTTFVKADTMQEAEEEVRRLYPHAIQVYVIREYLETWQMPVR
jgi:hypothetical protein